VNRGFDFPVPTGIGARAVSKTCDSLGQTLTAARPFLAWREGWSCAKSKVGDSWDKSCGVVTRPERGGGQTVTGCSRRAACRMAGTLRRKRRERIDTGASCCKTSMSITTTLGAIAVRRCERANVRGHTLINQSRLGTSGLDGAWRLRQDLPEVGQSHRRRVVAGGAV
jgi:hypothetical protein